MAVSDQENPQAPSVNPFFVRNHDAKRAIGPRLKNDVSSGKKVPPESAITPVPRTRV